MLDTMSVLYMCYITHLSPEPYELNTVVSPLLHTCGDEGLERLSHLLKVTQLVSFRSRLQIQFPSTPDPGFIETTRCMASDVDVPVSSLNTLSGTRKIFKIYS